MADDDMSIQNLGADLLDQLLWAGLLSKEEGKDALEKAKIHSNSAIREKAAFIEGYLNKRGE